jgi:tripartite-type tricarboxylate transporter receptor subunit TctC
MAGFRRISIALALAAVTMAASAARADPVGDFYKGKSIRVIIGYGAGGGYDLYGRLAAEFLGRHIPGNPTVVAQNMPGAGSFKAARFIYSAAPKDGTVLGSVAQTIAIEAAVEGPKSGIDVSRMPFLGRFTPNIDLGVGMPGAWFKTFEDARRKQIVVGATGGASTAVLLPESLNMYAGAKFKLVKGYKGAADVMMAAERHEVELIGATGIPNLLVRHPDWIKQHKAPILYQNALKRHPLLPDVPTLPELGTSAEGKVVLRLIASTAELGRSILTTPGVPKERLAALRKAFQAMLADPAFKETTEKRHITIEPDTGEAMDAIAQETMKASPSVLKGLAVLLKH